MSFYLHIHVHTHTALPSTTIGSLKISQCQSTSVQISWAIVREDDVIGYTVQVEGPDSTREIPIGNKLSTSVEISDLSPSTQYTFEVSAMKVSDAPGELKVSHSLPTSAQLSWTPVPEDKQNGTITGYIVQVEGPYSYSKLKEKKIGFPVMDGNATCYEVSNLKPYTTYTFSVSAITKIGTGLAKSISSATPQGAPSGSPKWLTVGCSLPTSVQLSWGAVPKDQQNGEITGYSMQVEGPNTTRNIQIHVATTVSDHTHIRRPRSLTGDSDTSKEVCDLKPSTEYSFSVSAMTVAGSGPAISVSFVMPQEALFSTIGRFKTSPYHPTSAQISWKGDEKVVTGYSVQVEGPDSTQVIPRRINTYVDILKLRPSTQYFFSVSAVTVAGTTPQRAHYSLMSLESDLLSDSSDATPYVWKSFFTATSGKNTCTAQYRMMLEYASSLEDALIDDTKIIWLATDLEKARLITEDQRKSLETSIDADIRAAELINMVTAKVCYSSENFATFLDVLKKDEATFGHILTKMKNKVPSGAPGELIVGHSLPTTAQLYWAPVPEDKQNDTITGYTVHVKGPDSTREIPVMDGNAISYEVSDLRPYTTYTFSVSAMTEAGAGPPIILSSSTGGRPDDRQFKPSLVAPYSSYSQKFFKHKTGRSAGFVGAPWSLRQSVFQEPLSSYSKQEPIKHKAGRSTEGLFGDPQRSRLSPDPSLKDNSSFQLIKRAGQSTAVLISDPMQLELRRSPSPPYSSSSLGLSSYSRKPIEQKVWRSSAGYSRLEFSPSPRHSRSLDPGSYSQALIKHKAEQSTGRASLSADLPKGYIKLRHLNGIKWKDESGKVQQFYLTEKIAHKWRIIGELVGLTYFKLQSLDDKYWHRFKTQQPDECCQAVLYLWLDNPLPNYPATWQGLIDLLKDSKLGEVATELKTVLSSAIDL